MTQTRGGDYNGAPRLQANTGYSARVRVRMTGALTQGTLHVHIYSASAGISTTGVSVPAAQISTRRVEGIYRADHAVGADSRRFLRTSCCASTRTARLHSNAGFLVDNIEIFPTAQPYNTSLVRASYAEDPESYDGVTGFMNVSENDGQTVRAAFLLRERMYFVKDRSHARDRGRRRERARFLDDQRSVQRGGHAVGAWRGRWARTGR